ncbi:AsmA family protein [Oceanimonas sp. CHS3-5]|uniref:AsmA family protein n=1 Tax=Oceanimonas sp. CHS3-5 TaxID=3068186 RepID=UPI00273D077F|nr:AsmA family protein [Oceanimonas sp. CHS3-5]MDP5291794.1 AsmA family protein [Oceanimonas sp. CHS3-5]
MRKWLYGVAVLLLLVLVGAFALTRLVDTDRVKRLLVEQTREKTGRTLVIDGDLSWRFFPSVGFTLGKTALLNPAGFEEGATLSVGEVSLDVALKPLFDNRLEVGEAVLSNARLHLITRKDGTTNLDDLRNLGKKDESSAGETTGSNAAEAQPKQKRELEFVSLAGVRVVDAEVLLQDERTDTLTRLNRVNLALDRFSPGEEVLLTLSGNLFSDEVQASIEAGGRLWLAPELDRLRLAGLSLKAGATGRAVPGNKELSLNGDLAYSMATQQAEFSNLALVVGSLTLDGKLSVNHATNIPKIRFDLHTPLLDLEQLSDEWSSEQGGAASGASATDSSETPAKRAKLPPSVASNEPDLSILKTLDVQGRLAADQLKVQGMEMDNLKLDIKVRQGKATAEQISARLYDGELKGKASLDANPSPARFALQTALNGVDGYRLLNAAAGMDSLEGRATVALDVTGRGLSAQAIKKSLNGTSRVEFADGALRGVNIAAMIRRGYAQVRGQPLPEDNEPQKTDFSVLTADFAIGKGKIATNNLNLASPLLRVQGEGETSLLDESLNVLLNTSIVGTLKGQDGESLDELKNITVPVRISGSYKEPRYTLDMQRVFDLYLKEKADKEAERVKRKLNEKLGGELGDKINEKLPGLFDKLGL